MQYSTDTAKILPISSKEELSGDFLGKVVLLFYPVVHVRSRYLEKIKILLQKGKEDMREL